MAPPEFRLELGASWLNLLSTVQGRRRAVRRDALETPQQLARWLRAVELAPRRPPDGDDHAAAIRLREALYPLARAAADGGAPPRAAVQTLNEFLAADPGLVLGAGRDGLRAQRPADTAEALARLARQAADQLTGPGRPRLRACDDHTCAGVFVDDSGRRRWCNDTRCGSRARVRAHRARLGAH